jgi:hypothetical protein
VRAAFGYAMADPAVFTRYELAQIFERSTALLLDRAGYALSLTSWFESGLSKQDSL